MTDIQDYWKQIASKGNDLGSGYNYGLLGLQNAQAIADIANSVGKDVNGYTNGNWLQGLGWGVKADYMPTQLGQFTSLIDPNLQRYQNGGKDQFQIGQSAGGQGAFQDIGYNNYAKTLDAKKQINPFAAYVGMDGEQVANSIMKDMKRQAGNGGGLGGFVTGMLPSVASWFIPGAGFVLGAAQLGQGNTLGGLVSLAGGANNLGLFDGVPNSFTWDNYIKGAKGAATGLGLLGGAQMPQTKPQGQVDSQLNTSSIPMTVNQWDWNRQQRGLL